MKLSRYSISAAALLIVAAIAPARAAGYQVKMLNSGAMGIMTFEPAFIKVKPGDSVTFVPTAMGHNAESLAGLIPAAATPFKGAINQALRVTFTKPGLYAYKCTPHLGLGMVGLVEVASAANKPAIAIAADKLPPLAKARMAKLLAQAN